ncbi:MAG: hypothetical protein V2A65_05990 [Candidatus Omnitrophota bacterium]
MERKGFAQYWVRSITSLFFILLAVSLVWTSQISAGEAKKEEKVEKSVKSLTGEVGGVGPNFLAIVYAKDEEKGIEYEMALPLDENAQFQSVDNLKDLEIGDKVTIQYEEETTTHQEKVTDEKGAVKEEERKEINRKGKAIKFNSKPAKSSIYVGSETSTESKPSE